MTCQPASGELISRHLTIRTGFSTKYRTKSINALIVFLIRASKMYSAKERAGGGSVLACSCMHSLVTEMAA